MSSVVRLKTGDAPDSGQSLSDTNPDSQTNPLPVNVVRRAASPWPSKSHLAPCGQCGALNGLSATVCWSCEADLTAARSKMLKAAAEGDEVDSNQIGRAHV